MTKEELDTIKRRSVLAAMVSVDVVHNLLAHADELQVTLEASQQRVAELEYTLEMYAPNHPLLEGGQP